MPVMKCGAVVLALLSLGTDISLAQSDTTPKAIDQMSNQSSPGKSDELVKRPVTMADGSPVGRIERLIVDGDRVTAAVVEIETALGQTIRRVRVPIEQMQPTGDTVVLTMTRTQLAALPTHQ